MTPDVVAESVECRCSSKSQTPTCDFQGNRKPPMPYMVIGVVFPPCSMCYSAALCAHAPKIHFVIMAVHTRTHGSTPVLIMFAIKLLHSHYVEVKYPL